MEIKMKKQIERIKMLDEMMKEEMELMTVQIEALKKWNDQPERSYYNRPSDPKKAQLQRIMMMLRLETIKLEKIL